MDEELKQYLDARFSSVDAKISSVDARFSSMDAKISSVDARFSNVDARFSNLERLIENTKDSLEREIGQVRDLMTDIQRRLDRQAGLIQTGARHTTRMVRWSEQVDQTIEDLRMRVQLLEHKRNGGI